MTIRVVIADDQALVREGLAAILSHGGEFDVVARCENGRDAVEQVRDLTPDVVVMDIQMPKMDGLIATRLITADHPSTKVVIVTTFDEGELLQVAIENGASGFLLKGAGPEMLKEAIRAAASGEALVSPALTVRLFERLRSSAAVSGAPRSRSAAEPLTAREEEVIRALARGRSNAELACELQVSVGTVKTHLANIQRKLNARNRVEIAAWAWESGLMG